MYVDDEQPALDNFRLTVAPFLEIDSLVLFRDGESALNWTRENVVDVAFLAVVIIALHTAERFRFYDSLFVQKRKHEVIFSFIGLYSIIGAFILICGLFFGELWKYLAVTAIMAWGPGDAMAAITGINFGKHKLTGKWIEGAKSVEGTIAMAATSFLCVTAVLFVMTDYPPLTVILSALTIAPVAALTELFTRKGWDTVTVPIVSLLILLIQQLIY